MSLSNKAIDRLGKKLVTNSDQDPDLLIQLQEFRVSHKEALSKVFNTVCDLSKTIRKQSIVTYRIKRIDSIIRKLERLQNRKLSKIGDIGGCRCILKNNSQVYKLRDEIGKVFNIRKENDYFKDLQDSGYKSLHLYLDVPGESKQIELQIRNQIDHNWATLVEISDVIFDAGLKEYSKDRKLFRFHYLLSKSTLNYKEMSEVANIIDEYDYIEKLSEVFSRNNNAVRKQWMKIEENPNNKFFLIASNKNDIPSITSFKTFESAERSYLETYLDKSNTNLLLTHLPNPNYEQISIAYSNYILTFHSFLSNLFSHLKSLIKKALVEENVFNSIKYFNLYYKTNYSHFKNIIEEVVHRYDYHNSNKVNKKQTAREKAWDKKLKKNIDQITLETKNFRKIIESNIPNSFFRRVILKQSFIHISKKYSRKMDSILKQQSE